MTARRIASSEIDGIGGHKDLQDRLSILKNRFLLSLIFLTSRRSTIPNLTQRQVFGSPD